MSIGDNIKRFATDTAKIAVKKSEDVIEKVKNKYNEFDVTTDIQELYKKLGEAVYGGYKNDEDISERISLICGEIDDKFSELENLKNSKEEFSYALVCPNCSEACSPEAKFCPKCGEKLS